MSKDKIGVWLKATEDLGEDVNIKFGHIQDSTQQEKPQWQLLSHKEFDGIGGLIYLLHQSGYPEKIQIPLLRQDDRPNFLKKLVALYHALRSPLPATPLISSNAATPVTNPNNLITWKIFSHEETLQIQQTAAAMDISLNTFLLYHLNQAVLAFFESPSNQVSWRIPVNLRGAVRPIAPTANQWGFIQVIYEKTTTPQELQHLIKDALQHHGHWGTWLLCNLLGSLSAQFLQNAIKKDIEKGFFLTGVFSNLGDWSQSNQNPHEAWVIGVPVTKCVPVGGVALIWAEKLALTLQLHHSLCQDTQILAAMMADWINHLLKKE